MVYTTAKTSAGFPVLGRYLSLSFSLFLSLSLSFSFPLVAAASIDSSPHLLLLSNGTSLMEGGFILIGQVFQHHQSGHGGISWRSPSQRLPQTLWVLFYYPQEEKGGICALICALSGLLIFGYLKVCRADSSSLLHLPPT